MYSLWMLVALICLLFLVCVVWQVKTGRLLLRYALLWLVLAVMVMLSALFPDFVYAVSDVFGFEAPSNFIFLVALFFLLAICLSLSIIVSGQARKIKSLVQSLAILENKMGRFDE